MMQVNYNNCTKQGSTRRDMLNCRGNFRRISCSVRKVHLSFLVDEEVDLIVYCSSGVCGGLLVLLAIFIGVNLGKAKKNFDEHIRQR